MSTTNKPTKNKSFKRTLARLLLGSFTLLAILGLTTIFWKISRLAYNHATSTEVIDGQKFIKPKSELNEKKAITISEELADRISKNSDLPTSGGSDFHKAWFQETQESNELLIEALLEQLASELGSSETLGILRTIKENKGKISEASQLAQSNDPNISKDAKDEAANLKEEIKLLTKKLTESYHKDGFELTEDQVLSLISSPHGEETASIINCFQNIKAICFVMENRLRNHPSHEMARKYYGSYHAMLLALDKIQKNTINKIHQVHIPEAAKVRLEARNTRNHALELLTQSMSNSSLSFNQREALQYNIQSCEKTEKKAVQTEDKLLDSSISLQENNRRLQFSIGAAQNSHTAMRLHTEIQKIGQDHIQELEKLEQITLPDMIAADFSDPNDPWLSPPIIRNN